MSKYTHYAKALTPAERKKRIASLSEADLRKALVTLWQSAMPDSSVHLTHGAREQGKDLVIVREQPFGVQTFALVVKAGKITADASGPLDVVRSQAEQAFEIPAVIPSRLDRLPVNEVWIVASGQITLGARERLEAQVLKFHPRFIDADELDELFVEHYPEIYFKGELLRYVDQTALALERDHFGTPGAVARLSDIFVEPYLLAADYDDAGEGYDIDQFLSEHRIRFGKLNELVAAHPRILIVGDPGVGKSASLRKLAVDGLHAAASTTTVGEAGEAEVRIPLFVKANLLLTCNDGGALCQAVLPEAVPRTNFTVSQLLVDGLDEVPADRQEQVIENARRCAEELDAPLIVTSRNIEIARQAPEGFKRLEMLPFEFGQAVELFKRLVTNPDTLNDLKDALEEIRANLALTPLSLVLLVQLAENSEEIPATIGELYDRFTDEVLGKYDISKGIDVVFEYQVKKRFLAALAFHEFYRKGRLEVPREDFAAFVREHWETYAYAPEKMEQFVDEIRRSGLLKMSADIQFRHRSFLEYFGSLQVVQEPELVGDITRWVVETYYDHEWSDLVFYYFGHRRLMTEEALSSLLTYSETDDIVVRLRKFMIGRLLQAGWHTPVPTRVAGVRGALSHAGEVRSDFKSLAQVTHGDVPEILADVALLAMAERSFRSAVLEPAARQLLDSLPSAESPEEEWLGYVALLRAMRRQLGDDDLLEYAAKLEAAVFETNNRALQGRILLLTGWALEDQPAAKKSLERKYVKLARSYSEAVKGILPPPRHGWRPKKRKNRD